MRSTITPVLLCFGTIWSSVAGQPIRLVEDQSKAPVRNFPPEALDNRGAQSVVVSRTGILENGIDLFGREPSRYWTRHYSMQEQEFRPFSQTAGVLGASEEALFLFAEDFASGSGDSAGDDRLIHSLAKVDPDTGTAARIAPFLGRGGPGTNPPILMRDFADGGDRCFFGGSVIPESGGQARGAIFSLADGSTTATTILLSARMAYLTDLVAAEGDRVYFTARSALPPAQPPALWCGTGDLSDAEELMLPQVQPLEIYGSVRESSGRRIIGTYDSHVLTFGTAAETTVSLLQLNPLREVQPYHVFNGVFYHLRYVSNRLALCRYTEDGTPIVLATRTAPGGIRTARGGARGALATPSLAAVDSAIFAGFITELWISDGTAEGSRLYGPQPLRVEELTPCAPERVAFVGDDGTHGRGLYSAHAAEEAPVFLGVSLATTDTLVRTHHLPNGRALFHTVGGIWETDGTPAGTVPVSANDRGTADSSIAAVGVLEAGAVFAISEAGLGYGAITGPLFVAAPDGMGLAPIAGSLAEPGMVFAQTRGVGSSDSHIVCGIEYREEGSGQTDPRTPFLKSVSETGVQTLLRGVPGGYVEVLADNAPGALPILFAARASTAEPTLLGLTDGVTTTSLVTVEGFIPSRGARIVGNAAYLLRDFSPNGREAYRVDLKTGAIELAFELEPGGGSSVASVLGAGMSTVFFETPSGGVVRFTPESGTVETLSTLDPGLISLEASGTFAVSGDTAFWGTNCEDKRVRLLACAKETSTATVLLEESQDFFIANFLYPQSMLSGGRYFFLYQRSETELALAVSDGTPAGTRVLRAYPWLGFHGPYPRLVAPAEDGGIFLTWNDFRNGSELWYANGTAEGMWLVQDLAPGTTSGLRRADRALIAGGRLFFPAFTLETGYELFSTSAQAPVFQTGWLWR